MNEVVKLYLLLGISHPCPDKTCRKLYGLFKPIADIEMVWNFSLRVILIIDVTAKMISWCVTDPGEDWWKCQNSMYDG